MRRVTGLLLRWQWGDICLPKKEGGLGIPNIYVVNKDNMVKHQWDLARKKDSLWVKWCHTYITKDKCLWTLKCHQNASQSWTKILKLRASIHKFIKSRLGNGQSTFLWIDNWHPVGSLIKRFGTRIIYDARSNIQAKVRDYVREESWCFPNPDNASSMQLVVQSLPDINPNTEDSVYWTLHSSGNFTSATAKDALGDHRTQEEWWKLAWFKGHIPRQAFFCRWFVEGN